MISDVFSLVCQVCPISSFAIWSNSQQGVSLFIWLSRTHDCRSVNTTTKSILDLQPRVFWCQVLLWTPLCSDMVLIIDKLWLVRRLEHPLGSSHSSPTWVSTPTPTPTRAMKYPSWGTGQPLFQYYYWVLWTAVWCVRCSGATLLSTRDNRNTLSESWELQ